MFITIINDCHCANAALRQQTRAVQIFNAPVFLAGVNSDLEAAGNLIDALDASEGRPGVILVNVAPRNGRARKWPNGTPFGYFYFRETMVVSSMDGFTLSLVKKLQIAEKIQIIDLEKTIEKYTQEGIIAKEEAEKIKNTQFRSYEFLPRVARWILDKREVISQELDIKEIPDINEKIWWVDNFGNCKTTILEEELNNTELKSRLEKKFGKVYKRLKDVPDKETAIVVGSSGLGSKRFLEVVAQGESAAKKFNIKSGNDI